MLCRKTLNILYFSLLVISNICVASDSKDYYKSSINDCNGNNITLMSSNGHENDVLFPSKSDNNTEEKKELYLEFKKDSSYEVIYDNRVKSSTHDIRLLPIFLNPYIDVSSLNETTEKEMHVLDDFTVVYIDCKKIVFNGIKSNRDDFDLVITNNRGETLGVVFNLSGDSKVGNIHLNNIDSLTVNTNNYKFNYKKISAIPDSTLKVLTHNSKSVSRIEK